MRKQVDQKKGFSVLLELWWVSLRLGLTSFGGPTAHLGYFHEAYVKQRKWMDEKRYADLVALSQFLPGPASSQVGIGIGITRAGIAGGIVSFLGFTLPSVLALILFATLVGSVDVSGAGWIQGLKLVAVAIVAQAVIGMAAKLTPDPIRKSMAVVALGAVLLWQTAYIQIAVISVAGIVGWLLYRKKPVGIQAPTQSLVSKKVGALCLSLFFGLLILLPLVTEVLSSKWLAMFDGFYRSGALVFGGGHVVLPLLQQEFVPQGWITEEAFLSGYAAAQAVPGPLFTFAAYLGTVMNGWQGGLFATFAIFLPAFLLIVGALPFWDELRRNASMQGALIGVNAAVVGILAAALYNPVWTSAVQGSLELVGAVVLYAMLAFWKLPPWTVVLAGAIGGYVLF